MPDFVHELQEITDAIDEIELFRSNYLIDDVIGNYCKILFILESPDRNEIICKYPAAGDTGISMSKIIFNSNIPKCQISMKGSYDEIPLGKVMHENKSNCVFGIMNCCQIPMQSSPYCYNLKYSHFLESLNTIRKTKLNVKKRHCQLTQNIDNAIASDFNIRIASYLNTKTICLIIPCGPMATYFLNKYLTSFPCTISVVPNIPHPAYNNWFKAKNSSYIAAMMARINNVHNIQHICI